MKGVMMVMGMTLGAAACADSGTTQQATPGAAAGGASSAGSDQASGGASSTPITGNNSPSVVATGTSNLVVTLDGVAQKSVTYGLNGYSSLYFYSFDHCAWGQKNMANTRPNTTQEVMVKLPAPAEIGSTQFTASSATGDISIGESAPFVIITSGCNQTVYRVVKGTMATTGITGSAGTLTQVGTIDMTLSGGQPAKTVTVKGTFSAVHDCSSVTPATGAACTLSPMTQDFGLTLSAH
jgi:hypothetical protein